MQRDGAGRRIAEQQVGDRVVWSPRLLAAPVKLAVEGVGAGRLAVLQRVDAEDAVVGADLEAVRAGQLGDRAVDAPRVVVAVVDAAEPGARGSR